MEGYRFDPVKHVHTLDGKPLHGVTSVLKCYGDPSALINWAANCAVDYVVENSDEVEDGEFFRGAYVAEKTLNEARVAHTKKRDKAGEKGTEVHAQLEVALNQWIERGMTGDHENELVNKVTLWMFDNGIKPLASEKHVHSREHWYGGITDFVCEKDGKVYIGDFKTSGSIQTKAFIQCGAYARALKEMGEYKDFAGVIVVHIPRGKSFDPEKNVYTRYDVEALERAFTSILDVYKLDKSIEDLIRPVSR